MLTNNCDDAAPRDQVQPTPPPYEPSPDEATEAAQLFGELSDDLDVAEFEAWLEGLHPERYRAATRAIDTLRVVLIEYHADRVLDRAWVLGWLEPEGGAR